MDFKYFHLETSAVTQTEFGPILKQEPSAYISVLGLQHFRGDVHINVHEVSELWEFLSTSGNL